MNIQIFGTNKSFDTKKAQRWFKERGIKFQMIDMKEKGMSRGEFDNVCRAVGGWAKLVDGNAKDKDTLALLRWLDESQQADKLFKISSCCASLSCATGGRLPWGIARKCGRSGSKQAKHLIFWIVFSPPICAARSQPPPRGSLCNFLLDISRTVRYIIRYNAVRKSACRFTRLFQQAGGDASPAWPAVCCRFQAGAVKLSSRARVCRRYPGRRGVCPAAKRPFTRQLGWYRGT